MTTAEPTARLRAADQARSKRGETTIERHKVAGFDVRVWTSGNGPALLYLHGYEQHPGGAPFLVSLAERRRVLAPEHPGYGESTGFENVEELLDVVLFYRQLVESWGTGLIDVIGHDLGGMLAAELAALCPHLVRRLVLVDAYGLWLDGAPLPDQFALPEPQLRAAKWHDPEAAPKPEPSILEPNPDDPTEAILVRAQNLGVATKFMWPLPERGLRKRLPLIAAPTLVVHGESDGLIPVAYAEELVRLIPDARLHTVAEAGHLPMIERPDEFCAAVEAFLQGT